ncbi:MAG: glycosyltransferase [Patescibacteria group bacterium]|jgi:lipopolysaccharide biosynthesis glycosyltransferase
MYKRNVLVTLANKKYLKYAKQFFAGAYFNAGWHGDYLLLAHECNEKDTEWFKKKGIIVKDCKTIFNHKMAFTNHSIISKFYLFTDYFKKWDKVIYYDADVIIRSSLDKLIKVKGLGALNNCFNEKILDELISKEQAKKHGVDNVEYNNLFNSLKSNFDFKKNSFGAGMLAFNTGIIEKTTFSKLTQLVRKYSRIGRNADQLALNLYFYKRWQKLSSVYDIYIYNNQSQWRITAAKTRGIVLHFPGTIKPWSNISVFNKEWLKNTEKVENIDLNNIPVAEKWSNFDIIIYDFYLRLRGRRMLKSLAERIIFLIARSYYSLVHFVEKTSPIFFSILKVNKMKLLNIIKNSK